MPARLNVTWAVVELTPLSTNPVPEYPVWSLAMAAVPARVPFSASNLAIAHPKASGLARYGGEHSDERSACHHDSARRPDGTKSGVCLSCEFPSDRAKHAR